jgi:hypothetical protein
MRQALLVIAVVFCTSFASADDGVEFFEREIRPVLVEHCYSCHSESAKSAKGGLKLDTREAIRKGGESGPAVVPGKVDESLIIGALKHESFEMPPDRKLPGSVAAAFEKWIAMGAPDPRESKVVAEAARGIDLEAGRKFWAYRPLSRPDVPAAGDASLKEIDRFLAVEWERHGLAPAAAADRRTLLRRVTFDLIGLPPTPEEIKAFLSDPADDGVALATVVDRLLASPHYGERWGRYWLDLARYSESTGGGRSMLIPEAWRYRDYVVASFNKDKPLTQFILEQIAGDQLPYATLEEGAEQAIGSGFLALGATNYEEQDKTQLRMDVIDEQIDTIGKVFLGQTIGCARCHDHKFDPIPTADYYAMAGIFRSTQTLIHDNVSTWVTRSLPVDPVTRAKLDKYEAEKAEMEKSLAGADKDLRALRQRSAIVVLDDRQAKLKGDWKRSGESESESPTGDVVSSTSGGATFAVGSAVTSSGPYELRLEYTAGATRSSDVLIEIVHAGGQSEIKIDQKVSPPLQERFVSLGEFELRAESKDAVTVSADEKAGETSVGALVLIPRFAAASGPTTGGIVPENSLPGVVVDDSEAMRIGDWMESTSVKSYVGNGYIHDQRQGKGEKRVVFSVDLPKSGEYEVRMAYNASPGREERTPVRITHPAGEATVHVDETKPPEIDGLFHSLGRYRFANDQTAVVTVSTEETTGVVIVDAIQFLPVENADGKVEAARPAPAIPKNLAKTVDEMMRLQSQVEQTTGRLTKLKESAPPSPPKVPSVQDEKTTEDFTVCIRGNYKHPGAKVGRGYLQVASEAARPPIPEGQSGRLDLARWIASADNPLTARVYANRVWQRLMGAGLVRTVDNFGSTGEAPSHPELLDHLARKLIAGGWSTKALIREIVATRAYQMSSQPSVEAASKDPENRWVSHANRRRLDAEAEYDSLLTVGGRLDRTVGGGTVRDGTKSEYGYKFDVGRRAIYLPVFRNRAPDLFAVLDFADPNTPVGQRSVTTLPTQALFFMNNPLVLDQAKQRAEKIVAEGANAEAAIDRLFELALGRPASAREQSELLAFLNDPPVREEKESIVRWQAVVQSVMASLDFRYID